MMRFVENFINGSLFYDLAGVHNGNPVAHRSDNAEVVGNHDNRGSFFLRQLFQKLQNLCLYGQCDKHQHQGTKELLHIIFTIFVI